MAARLVEIRAEDLGSPRLRRKGLRLLDASWDGVLARAGFRERRADSSALGVGPDLPGPEAAWHLAVTDSDVMR